MKKGSDTLAKYRPKSLDELNSLYDKTVSTQNSIEATASAISTEAFPVESETTAEKIDKFFAEHSDISAGGCSDLTEDIQNFIRNFGKPATAEDEIAIRHHRPVPIKLRQLPTPPKHVESAVQPTETAEEPQTAPADTPAPQEAKPEKTEFVITAEKNELFEEYMRIMSDEDDDDYSKSRRKRKKNRKAAEAEAPKQEAPEPEAPAIAETEAEEDTTPSYAAPDYESDEEEATESFASFTEEKEEIIPLKEEKKPLSLTEDKDSPFADDDEEEDEEEKLPRKKTALQLLLILLLFVTLISALTVTAVQTLVKVNSGEKFMDKYYVYSATVTDKVTDINEGDLVFVEIAKTKDNEVFAYNTPNGVAYAVQTFSGEPERTSGKNGISDSIIVLNTSIKGKVTRIYPSLGKVTATISENFMTVIAGLLVLAIVIILLLIFAFRRTSSSGKTSQKDNLSFDDEQDDFDEDSDEDFSRR